MIDERGRLIGPSKANILKETILHMLSDEDVEILGIEVDIRLRNGYRDKVWYGWRNPDVLANAPKQAQPAR